MRVNVHLVPQRLVVEDQQNLQLWLLMSAGPKREEGRVSGRDVAQRVRDRRQGERCSTILEYLAIKTNTFVSIQYNEKSG